MALETLRSLPQLKEECQQKHIDVFISGKKERKEDYIRALRNYWLKKYYGDEEHIPWALRFMLSIDCPQLCKRYQQCNEKQQKMFWESSDYIAEEKIDGNREIICFDATTKSFDFYSRNNSVKDYLPQSYKDTILTFEEDFDYPENFVLDSEIICTNSEVSTVSGKRGTLCSTQLQSTAALLSLNPKESREIQKKNPLKFIVFDCLFDGVSLMDKPWKERREHTEKLVALLRQKGFLCEINPYVSENKLEFYSDIIERNGEGVVFKNIKAPYHACSSRTNDQVKLKRSVSDSLCKDLDAWVTGFIPSSKDKGWSDKIGALVFSCKVRMNNGDIKIHEIGVCSGISQELRNDATILVDGVPTLNPKFLGRVATLSGQNISARKLSLTHCVIVTWRPDKDASGCEILTEEELRNMVF